LSKNIGHKNALFEPIYGTVPDLAGEGIGNPSVAVLSVAMRVEHLG